MVASNPTRRHAAQQIVASPIFTGHVDLTWLSAPHLVQTALVGSATAGHELLPCPYDAQKWHVGTCKSSDACTIVHPTDKRGDAMTLRKASGSTFTIKL